MHNKAVYQAQATLIRLLGFVLALIHQVPGVAHSAGWT